ncbi:MAG: DUF3017 domain-containing protein [Nocardioides sp.]
MADAVPEPEREPDILPPEEAPRRYPSTIGGALYVVAMVVLFIGIYLAAREDWRLGVRWMAGSLLFAAGCRALLPSRQAGMLAVRNRVVDVALLTGAGVAMIVLAGSIPNQPL